MTKTSQNWDSNQVCYFWTLSHSFQPHINLEFSKNLTCKVCIKSEEYIFSRCLSFLCNLSLHVRVDGCISFLPLTEASQCIWISVYIQHLSVGVVTRCLPPLLSLFSYLLRNVAGAKVMNSCLSRYSLDMVSLPFNSTTSYLHKKM